MTTNRAELIASLEARLAELDTRIQELEESYRRSGQSVRRVLEIDMSELRARRAHAAELLSQLRLEDAEAWEKEDFRSTLLRVFDEIGERVSRLVDRLAEESGKQ